MIDLAAWACGTVALALLAQAMIPGLDGVAILHACTTPLALDNVRLGHQHGYACGAGNL